MKYLESFADFFSDINDLNSINKITINGKEITLEFFWGEIINSF